MQGHCQSHSFERATGTCRVCSNDFCQKCLLWPFGEKKPPFCIGCAIAASGVRSTAGHSRRREPTPTPAPAAPAEPKRSWRERREARARRDPDGADFEGEERRAAGP